jgi:hypothetical protein
VLANRAINMQTEIDFVIDNPEDRKPLKAIVRYAGTENVITRSEVKDITPAMVKLWRMMGLTDADIKRIVGFLRS